MCGIVGYIGTQPATDILLAGLEKLEYRGYDSAGIARIYEGEIECIRAKGKLHNLRDKLTTQPNPARIGIGHTRWATHGKPEEYNAHPHMDMSMRIAVVQNGIIENYRELREELKAKGHQFRSDTDTEVIPHLIAEHLKTTKTLDNGHSPLTEAVRQAVNQLRGAFAIAVISADYEDELVLARQQAPLAIGFGSGEFFCASDTPALVAHTKTYLVMENKEIARLTPLGVEIYNFNGDRLKKSPRPLAWNPVQIEKQGFKYFMLKEIYEQPGVVRSFLARYVLEAWGVGNTESPPNQPPIQLDLPSELYQDLQHIQILGCGSSWHAGLIGRYLLEQLSGIPTSVYYASEFRYAPPPLLPNTLTIGVTQSGETADTLAALNTEIERRQNKAKPYEGRFLGITNRPESSITRLVHHIIDTQAGIEIGVAATKSFIGQVLSFYALAIELAYKRNTLSNSKLEQILTGLRQLPALLELILESQERYIQKLTPLFIDTQDFVFLGRGINFPIALEAALKLKEISYIHAEGYPAGEMKHGPIALLDSKVPVVAIAIPGIVYEKVLSNAQEAKARDSQLLGIVTLNDQEAAEIFDHLLPIPEVEEILSPILTVIPLQLLAYHIATHRGLDVDQPRNLAKSVTVE